MKRYWIAACLLTCWLLATGCGSPDQRLADLAQQAAHDQALQSQRVAESGQLVAKAQGQLIDADARSRTELIALQQDLRADQADIGRRRDELEVERRQIAHTRLQNSATADGLVTLGLIVACLAPLVLAGAAVLGLFCEPTDAEVSQVLVDELVAVDAGGNSGSSDALTLRSSGESAV